jgi:hypothetical protein
MRPEMKGPQTSPDLENLLSGLKTKKPDPPMHTAPAPAPTPAPAPAPAPEAAPSTMGTDSIISISSLKDLDGTPIPKKTRRRQNTSKSNTVSLDI